jgi:hypothetical protein
LALDTQINVLLGINNSVLSIATAINNLASAMSAASSANALVASVGAITYSGALGYWGSQAAPGQTAEQAYAEAIKSKLLSNAAFTDPTAAQAFMKDHPELFTSANPAIDAGWVTNPAGGGTGPGGWWWGAQPGYAEGGYTPGGWAVTGERGPELVNFSSPARIYSSSDSKTLLNTKPLEDRLDALRADLRPFMLRMMDNSNKSYDLMEQWDIDGIPPERT